jgi:hypothetical protein
MLRPHLQALAAAPASVDWYSGITDWPMYGNADWGDCVEAGQGHHEEVFSFYGGHHLVEVTDQSIIDAYTEIAGFDPDAGPPGDNPTDQGTLIQDAMSYWRKTGIGGHKIAAFAEVSVADMTEVKTALALFGPLSIGINFPASAMDQFDAGEPWDVVKHTSIDGGHCVALVGYDTKFLYVVTWGRVQKVTQAFWNRYVEEAWAPISAEWVDSVTGLDPAGVDLVGLGEAFTSLTGEANPFPQPGPAPTPDPTPTPGPSGCLGQLLDELRGLVKKYGG